MSRQSISMNWPFTDCSYRRWNIPALQNEGHWVAPFCFIHAKNCNSYTRHLLRQTLVTPDAFYTRQLLHQRRFTPETFYTRDVLIYTRDVLHQTALTPETFYTRHVLHQTILILDSSPFPPAPEQQKGSKRDLQEILTANASSFRQAPPKICILPRFERPMLTFCVTVRVAPST